MELFRAAQRYYQNKPTMQQTLCLPNGRKELNERERGKYVRILKFRAWYSEKMWSSFIGSNVLRRMEWSESDGRDICLSEYVDINKLILMQFTGLHDKNGKEIWEGDIIKDWNTDGVLGHITKVSWRAPEFVLKDFKDREFTFFRGAGAYEVLGNLYENPELLKGSGG